MKKSFFCAIFLGQKRWLGALEKKK